MGQPEPAQALDRMRVELRALAVHKQLAREFEGLQTEHAAIICDSVEMQGSQEHLLAEDSHTTDPLQPGSLAVVPEHTAVSDARAPAMTTKAKDMAKHASQHCRPG